MKQLCKKENINVLACCEHARWNVEKLILGFKPLSSEDWYNIESCFGTERNKRISKLKKMKIIQDILISVLAEIFAEFIQVI